MKKTALICALIFAGVVFGGCSKSNQPSAAKSDPRITGDPSDPPIDLRINWQAGARYVMRMEMKQTSDFQRLTEGARAAQHLTLAHEYAITVTNDLGASSRALDVEVLSIEMEETAGERTVLNYDSQNRVVGTAGNPIAEQLERLVGGHLQYAIDSNQVVISEKGLNELLARANPKLKNPDRIRANRNWNNNNAVLRQATALEAFKQMLALTALPGRQLRIGDSWPVKFQTENSPGGAITITGTNAFRGWQEHDRKKCARIELTGLVLPRTNSTDRARAASARGMIFDDAAISGTFWVDPAAAFPTEVHFKQSFSRSGSIGPQRRTETNAPPQTFTAHSHQTISFKLIDINIAAASAPH